MCTTQAISVFLFFPEDISLHGDSVKAKLLVICVFEADKQITFRSHSRYLSQPPEIRLFNHVY